MCDPRQVNAPNQAPPECLPFPRPPAGGAVAPAATGSPASPGSDPGPAYIAPPGRSPLPLIPPHQQPEEERVTATSTSMRVLDGS